MNNLIEKQQTIVIDKAFKQLISLYDICDDLENDGEDKKSKKMRSTLNKLVIFIQSLKN